MEDHLLIIIDDADRDRTPIGGRLQVAGVKLEAGDEMREAGKRARSVERAD
jgi:hypothetical protein